MLDFTTDTQESSAIHGLLALRDCDSTSGSNNSPQSDSNSILTTPELHPNTKNNLVPQEDYKLSPPFNTSINHQFNQQDEVPKLSYASPQSLNYQFNSNWALNQTEEQAYYEHQEFNSLQPIQSNQLIYSPKQSQSKVTLPSIKDMIAQYPLSRYHRQSSTNISSSRGNHPERHARILANHPYLQKHTLMSLELLKKHNSHMLETQRSDCAIINEIISKSPIENNLVIQENNEPEVYIKQEFEKEQEIQSIADSLDTQDIGSEESDDGSLYEPSSSEKNKPITRGKKSKLDIKKNDTSRHLDKPRWTTQEKAKLFEAIVRHKSLDIMATFDWVAIGADTGRLDKACKDQWRRGILKMFRDYVSNL